MVRREYIVARAPLVGVAVDEPLGSSSCELGRGHGEGYQIPASVLGSTSGEGACFPSFDSSSHMNHLLKSRT